MATNDLIPFVSPIIPKDSSRWVSGKLGTEWLLRHESSKQVFSSVTAAAIVFAVLSEGTPIVLANATAFLVGTSAPQDGTGQSMPTIQPTADAKALPPTASEAPTGEEIAAAFETANLRVETEIRQPWGESLVEAIPGLGGGGRKNAQVQARNSPNKEPGTKRMPKPVVEDDQAQVVQNARAQVRPVQKQRTSQTGTQCAGKSPTRPKCPSTDAARAKCTGTGPARKYTTGPARAKCPATVAPAKNWLDGLDLAGSDALPCQAPAASADSPSRANRSRQATSFRSGRKFARSGADEQPSQVPSLSRARGRPSKSVTG